MADGNALKHSTAPAALTADVNALAWGQFHLRGGWPRVWGFAGFYAAAVGALVALAAISGNATAGPLKYALTGVQAAILVLFVAARVSAAIRQDLTSRMIESHRLMPLSPAQAVLGYLLGPAGHPLALAAANFVVGLFVSAAGGIPATIWLTANAVLLEFAAFVAVAMAFGAFSGKGSGAVVWLGFFVGVYSHAVIGFLMPALNVLATPLAGRTVFNLGVTGGDAVAFYAPAFVFHVAFGAIFFAGACRRYRRDDRLAVGTDLGLALLAAWVAASAFAIVKWEDYRPFIMARERSMPAVQFVGSLAAAMLVALLPLNGAAFAAADWAGRRALGDPALCRRPVPPLVVAIVAAGICLALAAVPVPNRTAGAVARTAIVLVAYCVSSLYALRLLYRRTGSSQLPLVALWLFLTWLVPLGIDGANWYLAQDRPETLGTVSSFSPLGALIELWTGRGEIADAGLIFQGGIAAVLAALFHLTGRRRPPGARQAPLAA